MACALDLREFYGVNIADVERNMHPHVAAGGFVTELHANDENADSSFKLTDDTDS